MLANVTFELPKCASGGMTARTCPRNDSDSRGATMHPWRGRAMIRPSSMRRGMTVLGTRGETPSILAHSLTVGSASPGRYHPDAIACRRLSSICAASVLRRVRSNSNGGFFVFIDSKGLRTYYDISHSPKSTVCGYNRNHSVARWHKACVLTWINSE